MTPSSEKMVKENAEIGSITLSVVRGEIPLDALREIGIEIDSEDGSYKLKSGNFKVAVGPSVSDVALGLLRYVSANRDELRKWAFFLLAESGAIDFSKIESHPQGELLISALWDASFEGRISSEAIAVAQHLTLRGP